MLQKTRANQIRVWTVDSAEREDISTHVNARVATTAIDVNMVIIGFDMHGFPKQVNRYQMIKNRIKACQ